MAGPAPLDQPTFLADFVARCQDLVRQRTRARVPNTKGRIWLFSFTNPRDYPTLQQGCSWICIPTLSASGGTAGLVAISRWLSTKGAGASPFFPLRDQAVVKAIACEAVCQTKLPLSWLSTTDPAARAASALGQPISPSTVRRILDADAIKRWRYE